MTDSETVAHEKRRAHAKALMLAGVAAIGGFLFGFDTSIINGAVSAIGKDFGIGSIALGFVVSSALLGCAVGAWFAGQLSNALGRVRVMLIAAILFFISAIGSALAVAAWDLVIWRVIGGLAVGAASVIAPAYIAEISPANMRGRLGSLQQLAIVSGIFVALLADFVFATAAGGANEPLWWGLDAWRWMFASAAIPAFAYGIMALQIPESPRYLVSKHELTRAREVLKSVLGGNVDQRITEIERSLKSDKPPRMGDLKGPVLGLLPIVWVGILLSVFQQFVGINVIFYYSSTLWEAVGFSQSDSMLISVITSVTNIVTTLVAIALVDKLGRKPLLLAGSAAMAVSLGVMAFIFATAPVADVAGKPQPMLGDLEGPIALVAANLFVFGFGCSWGPLVWVLLGEMFGNRIRASALAVAAAAQWVANWTVSATFPWLSEVGLGLAYGLYAGMAALSFVFVARAVRETKGRELEDMDRA
ncbi:sugar porter family MFS transporter [Stackebrandtia nassauensis]|uniref:Sugar transporter n=1 Tax=Stackebrandtia nassauensis (strain DSM 44728 / CIP 108903 / NRRL B-16338 / NBRC 102104 / LLR-40K-21) TaxID=446470 RepID=D3Q579_STANL|nr:sugar porter family MFS transporter [Stackebrandtia nassauensis]ADD44128.1 sugar transporter [Stackebrandtia nassauensis DSM 44728]